MPTYVEVLLIGVLGLFGVGFYALLATRNLFKVIVALQILVKGALLAIITAGRVIDNSHVEIAQSMATTVVVADTMVAVVGLALAIQVKRRFGTVDVNELSTLRG